LVYFSPLWYIVPLKSGNTGFITGGWFKDLEVVVTSAIGCRLGDDPHGMRIVTVRESAIDHKYYSLEDCPRGVDLN
jgi:hypothetical protein